MSTSAMFPTGGGKTWRSASSITATEETGYHLLTINGYSRTKFVPFDQCLKSRPFTVGSHRWCLCYYPTGQGFTCYTDHVCISLVLDQDVAVPVNAKFRIYLADSAKEDEQASSLLEKSEVHEFSSHGTHSPYRGWFRKRWQDIKSSGHLRNDSLTVRCDIAVVNNYRTEEDTTTFSLVPPCNLRQHLGDLLRSEKGADVVFEVAGETIAAHRCVLAARSSVFCAELFGSMKEGISNAAGVVVSIEDMDADVFKELLYFAYTGSLPTATPENVDEVDFIKLQHLLVAADRYDMERLKLMCEEKLCQNIDVGTVANVLALSEQHHCDSLKKACLEFLGGSQANMRTAMATEGFQHLRRSCPSLVDELIAMSLASQFSSTPMFK